MKKGFTLIELLAVIIVLAIIILIATPIIFNVIENAKLKALENSCYGVIDAVKTKYSENLLNSEDGIDNTIPTITPKQETVTINKETNKKIKKYFDVTFGVTGGEVTCENENVNSLEAGNHTIKCVATGTNGKTAESTINLTVVVNLKDIILKETIKGNNITWTNAWQESDESGLYSQSVEDKKTYYFRGQPTNNYLKFAGLDFRIVRVNEDGSIRIILADSIKNKVFNSNYDTYDKMYYTNSELKNEVISWFNTNITEENSNKVVTNGHFCENAKVVYDATYYTAGNANIITKDNYTPTFNCINDGNNKGKVVINAGLITYDEAIFAGGWYIGGTKYPYYLNNNTYFWTMTPAGFKTNSLAWRINSSGITHFEGVNNSRDVRPVINLKADTLVIGSGTSTNPYIVK